MSDEEVNKHVTVELELAFIVDRHAVQRYTVQQ